MALEFRHLFRSVSNSFDWHTRQKQCVNLLRWIIQTESKHNKAYNIYKNSCFYKSLISLTSNAKNWTGTNFLWSKNVNIKLIDIKHNKSKIFVIFLTSENIERNTIFMLNHEYSTNNHEGFFPTLCPFVFVKFYACEDRWAHFQIFTTFSSSVIVLLIFYSM